MNPKKPPKVPLERLITLYGRKSVLEALKDNSLTLYKLHLSNRNAPSEILDQIISLAKKRNLPIRYHDPRSLSFISKNKRQDQGVALDVQMPFEASPQAFLKKRSRYRLFLLEGITNPQNIGMIIRSATAGNIDGIVIEKKGSASLCPLTLKASAGTAFKIPVMYVTSLQDEILRFQKDGAITYILDSHAKTPYTQESFSKKSLFVFGNESRGVSSAVKSLAQRSISIPMRRGVESLNVAMSATLIAFCD